MCVFSYVSWCHMHVAWLMTMFFVFFSGLVMFLSCESPSSNRANYKYIYIYIHTYYIYIYIYNTQTLIYQQTSVFIPTCPCFCQCLNYFEGKVHVFCLLSDKALETVNLRLFVLYNVCCLIYNIVPAFSNIQMLLPLRNRWILCATLPLSCTLLWCANIQKRSVGRRTWGIETGALQPTQIFWA